MAAAPLPQKVWRRKLADEFLAHLIISTCVEITIRYALACTLACDCANKTHRYPRTDIADVFGHVIEIYHKRLEDQVMHPRSSEWSGEVEDVD